MRALLAVAIGLVSASLLGAQEEKPDKDRANIDKGLVWLVKQQAEDGGWPSDQNGMITATTAFAGMALLADGNTLTEGKYAPNLRKALAWFRTQKLQDAKYHGLLGPDPHSPANSGRYMSQHGVALSFLALLYGEAEGDDRVLLRKMLNDAVAFTVKGQSSFGGWFYTSSIEGHNSTENVTTMLVLQGLIDARNAGIAVPKETMQRSHRYLQSCTTEAGGIVYSGGGNMKAPPAGGGRPTITAMALAAFLPQHGRYDETTRRWLGFCADAPALAPDQLKKTNDLLPHYYFGKAVFHLNETEWRTAFPDKKIPGQVKWTTYRTTLFDHLHSAQQKDGSWSGNWGTPGQVFNTSLALNILLYEKTWRAPLSR